MLVNGHLWLAAGRCPACASGPPSTWRRPPAAQGLGQTRSVIRPASLPPPSLSGSAASNPRSVFNPLALAYLGDAVWEAHTRALQVHIDARSSQARQRQQQERREDLQQWLFRKGQGEAPATGRGRGGGRGGVRGHGGGRGCAAERGAAERGAERSGGGGGASPSPSSSRQARQRWSTAEFQALVYDALMDGGGLPLTPLEPLSPTAPGASPSTPQDRLTAGEVAALAVEGAAAEASGPAPVTLGAAAAVAMGAAAAGAEVAEAGAGAAAAVVSLSAEEAEVLRWGRNAAVSSVPRGVPVGVYKKATAVEVLVAHMYLTHPDRCAALIAAAVTAPLPLPPGQMAPTQTPTLRQTLPPPPLPGP